MKSAAKKTTAKKKFCAQEDCREEAKTHGFCRLHYITNWKQLKQDKVEKAEKRLNAYVDRLAKKYPDDYLERIKQGLEDEEKFKQSVEELDLDPEAENTETEREFLEKFIRGIKGDE